MKTSTIRQIRLAAIIAIYAFLFMKAWTPFILAVVTYGWSYMYSIDRLERLLHKELDGPDEEKSDDTE